jgi:uncharacterized lipoprotein YmbA
MNHRFAQYTLLLFCLTTVWLGGCASSSPSRFYVLSAVSTSEPQQPLAGELREVAIGVGPVELPRYLDRPQMATRAGPYELQFAEFNQWAEPLADNVTRVLSENLSHLLGTDRITIYPWPRSTPVAYQVIVQMTHFEGTLGEQSRLSAQWHIIDVEEQQELLRQTSQFRPAVETADYDSLAAALSHGLSALSQDIAAALRALPRQRAAR